jgi:hypothetical protein
MSKLQIEVAARLKTSNRIAGDQKSRKALVFVVLCTRQTMQIQFPGFKLLISSFSADWLVGQAFTGARVMTPARRVQHLSLSGEMLYA